MAGLSVSTRNLSIVQRVMVDGPRGTIWSLELPETHRERARGLRGRRQIAPDQGMWFARCRSVHTVGMTMPIRVVCLDRRRQVRRTRVMVPGRLLLPRPVVQHILECAHDADVRLGDRFGAPLSEV